MAMDINVVTGTPIVDLHHLYSEESIDLFTKERYLPKILVEIGFFTSISQVRKNRPDLLISLNKLDFIHIRVGKNHLWLTVGE